MYAREYNSSRSPAYSGTKYARVSNEQQRQQRYRVYTLVASCRTIFAEYRGRGGSSILRINW